MKPIVLCFLFISLGLNNVYAQQDSVDETKWSVKIAPLCLLDMYNGSLAAIGTEIKLHKQFALYTEFGKYFTGFDTRLKNIEGFIIKEELKYYLNQHKTLGMYFSVELCHAQQSFIRTDSIELSNVTRNNLVPKYAKTYEVNRSFQGMVFQFGEQYLFKKRWIIDISGGLGFRLNHVRCDLSDNEAKAREFGDWSVATNWVQRKGDHVIHKMNFSLKIGYRIFSLTQCDLHHNQMFTYI